MNPSAVLQAIRLRFAFVAAAFIFLAILSGRATILTFEDFTVNNFNVSSFPNPFGSGQYGSRANSAINVGFQQGDGWTPNVVLTWGTGWHTYTAWPFGNNAQTAAGKVAQADFAASGGAPLTLTFTPDSGIGVLLKSFAFTVWDSSPVVPVQIRWTLYGGSVAPANVLASGTSSAIGAAGGAETINTGLSSFHWAATPVILRWELLSGDPIFVAINNVHYTQGPARQPAALSWPPPDAILTGTSLSSTQLNATANVAGSFMYNPPGGTVLPAGQHTLTTEFTPADTNTYAPAIASAPLLVKSNSVPIISVRAPQKIGTNDPLSLAMFQTSADVRGTFSFSPPPGTRLPPGTNIVTFTFMPSNSVFATVNTNVPVIAVASVPEGTIWTFSDPSDRFRALCGDDVLSYHDPSSTGWYATKVAFGTASSLGLPLPTGGDTHVMCFSNSLASEGFKVTFNDLPNGVFAGSGWVANYTLIFDLLYPSNRVTRPLFNAGANNGGGPEAFVNNAVTAAVQVNSISYGEIRANTWHRVAIVVRASTAEGQAHVYVDGTFVGAIGSNDSIISAGYALDRVVYLLTSGSGNGSPGYLSGLRFVGRNLDYSEINNLGGVHADGPHVPGAPASRPPFQPLRDVVIIGHRGNSGFAPENTLPSYVTTFAAGGQVVEVDVRRTSDNRVVAMHDPSVDRTTDGTGNVASMTLAQVQALDAGSWFGPQFVGTRPPSLRQVMTAALAYPGTILYLDLKVNGLASLVETDADTAGFPADRLWFWVYSQETEAAAYRSVFSNGKIIWGEGNWFNGASISTWPGLSAAQKLSVANGMKARGVWGFDFGDNEATSLNPTTLQELRAHGFFVSTYSALHPRSMTSAINYLGVDGMETDFPAVLRSLMPFYTAMSSATPLSDTAAQISWSTWPLNPAAEIRVRAKPRAAPAWSNVATGLSARTRVACPTGLRTNTLYEFQPIAYDSTGNPTAFGSVTEAITLAAGNNFSNAYANWQTNYPGVGAPGANPDGDAFVNLIEFGLGLNPFDPSVPPPSHPRVSIQGSQIVVQYTRRAGAYLKTSYDSSPNLQQWTPLFELTDYTVSIQPGSPGMENVTVRVPVPPNTLNWFIRTHLQALP